MNMEYPFEFSSINLTDTILEKLGFADWWGGSGDFYDSVIHLADKNFHIHALCEKDDENDGYGHNKVYVSYHYTDSDWNRLFFLHELYEFIKSANSEEALHEFKDRCKKVNLSYYIDSYENYIGLNTIKCDQCGGQIKVVDGFWLCRACGYSKCKPK